MISESNKLEKFIEEINRNADAQVAAIRKETKAYVKSELNRAKAQAMREIHAAQFTELDKLNEKNNSTFSETVRCETKNLLKRRREITDEVFAEVERRVKEFTESSEYAVFLEKCAAELSSLVGGVFYIRPADEKYSELLKKYCDEIQLDGAIVLGGIKTENAEKKLSADDTLDSRIAAERNRFYEESGLSVTLQGDDYDK